MYFKQPLMGICDKKDLQCYFFCSDTHRDAVLLRMTCVTE